MKISLIIFLCLVNIIILPLIVTAQLQFGFYDSACPQAELIVRQVVQNRFATDPSIAAALLRMHFHDCFVRGCDASILIDSTPTNSSEKDAGANQTVRGFDLIDDAKDNLESECPGIVSCADIIVLATRESVGLAGGPNYNVPTGRRDGLVSDPDSVGLPGPGISVSGALQLFTDKGLTLNDMVLLLGAHTVGVAHCFFFDDRLSNFQGTGKPDPSMDPTLVTKLANICENQNNTNPTAFLDQNTSFIVDNEYYNQLLLNRGIMQIDQALALDSSSAPIVSSLGADALGFQQAFANALVKMGSIEVLVGNDGEIRQDCRVFN